jgi:hypothetical protein
MLPCQSCASGRNTTDVSAQQVAATNCFVTDGYGVFDQAGATAAAQWFDSGVSGLSTAQQAQLEVAMCPVGRYSDSQNSHGDVAARCVACPAGSATTEAGSTDITDCTGTLLAQCLSHVCACMARLRTVSHATCQLRLADAGR